jgi:TPR repeat protein
MLGRYLRKGLAGPADPVAARHWLERAVQLGVDEANTDLSELDRASQPLPPEAALSYRVAGD